MLPTTARTALLAAAGLFAGRACAETSPSSGVVVAPIAPPPNPSAPAVDPSTAPASSDASVAGEGGDEAGEKGAPTRFRSCGSSADCVAVPRVGCCHNGWNEAVAASQRDAYAASFVCPQAHPICAMFIVRDTRIPECDAATH